VPGTTTSVDAAVPGEEDTFGGKLRSYITPNSAVIDFAQSR